jgi:hypothetical protein
VVVDDGLQCWQHQTVGSLQQRLCEACDSLLEEDFLMKKMNGQKQSP